MWAGYGVRPAPDRAPTGGETRAPAVSRLDGLKIAYEKRDQNFWTLPQSGRDILQVPKLSKSSIRETSRKALSEPKDGLLEIVKRQKREQDRDSVTEGKFFQRVGNRETSGTGGSNCLIENERG